MLEIRMAMIISYLKRLHVNSMECQSHICSVLTDINNCLKKSEIQLILIYDITNPIPNINNLITISLHKRNFLYQKLNYL